MFYHQNIVEVLDSIKRELLLVLKTNNYLRAIDKRLGNPINTYNVINEVTWDVYRKEISKDISFWTFFREASRYYYLKLGLLLWYFNIRIRSALGFKVDKDELKDFDLDVIDHENPNQGK